MGEYHKKGDRMSLSNRFFTFISCSFIVLSTLHIYAEEQNKQAQDNFLFELDRYKDTIKKPHHAKPKPSIPHQPQRPAPEQSYYTVIIYMAADNDLFPFAGRNIKQLENIGSNKNCTILIHLDMHRPGKPKLTKRFLVEKNKITQIGPDMAMDSGSTQTLIDCCRWGITNYPAQDYILILWNHGTGIIEPFFKKAINPSQLFNYNPETKMIELNRSIGFLDYIDSENNPRRLQKGICFDDSTQNYLTNQKVKDALQVVCSQYLGGKKFAILGCDACLMSMLEVACPLKDYAHILVSSQEVELGTGWDYGQAFYPFTYGAPDNITIAQHFVSSFNEAYGKITQDYTQSALSLATIGTVEQNVHQLAKLLIEGLKKQKNRSVKEAIRLSRHKNACTSFDEPSYIDLYHFCSNLKNNLSRCELTTHEETELFKTTLGKLLDDTKTSINNSIISCVTGKNLKNAHGISIYFPEGHIHSSYAQSYFAIRTAWLSFLLQYLGTN